MKKLILIVVVIAVAFGVMGAGCGPSGHIVQYSYTTAIWNGDDPGYHVYLENSLIPSLATDAPTMCGPVLSTVAHRDDVCRVVRGLEELGDNRNWRISYYADGKPGGGPQTGSHLISGDWKYGLTFTTEAGTTYEGCYWRGFSVGDDSYICDFRTTNQFIETDNIQGGLGNILDNMWHWSWYELKSDVACAKGIAEALKGSGSVTTAFLLDCSDEPYGG